jgi:hypothetical protein
MAFTCLGTRSSRSLLTIVARGAIINLLAASLELRFVGAGSAAELGARVG